ncbi:MAG: helix-turn-helix domain-containing protein [Gemmatimonadales bacterium]
MTSLRRLVADALRAATPTVEMVAEALGLSTSALRRYRLGDRTPSPDVLRALGAECRRQARVLDRYAHQLEEAASQEEQDA